jgi:hypothetical protein
VTVVEDAFRAMVDQFKDPLAFLRELIQNALDAGSTTIDVSVSGAPEAKGSGYLVTLEVQDTGDGMDREIIENKLTRLFASSKDGDATKIGKFGVGFSSTFSIRPEAVVVDTARGNERWRVVFSPDGTWKLYTLDEPIEGTRVRVLKRVAKRDEAEALVGDALRTVKKWCRYADAHIHFNGSSIAEPFGVPSSLSPVSVRVPGAAPGDVIVVALTLPTVSASGGAGAPGVWGFYNKGLTLLEGVGPFDGAPSWVSFRVRDGAIEHTITRDNVIRDDAFDRVMRAVHEAAHGPLIDAALDALEGAGGASLSPDQRSLVCAALAPVMRTGALDKPAARGKRKIFRDARGAGLSLADVRAAIKAKTLRRVEGAVPGGTGDNALAGAFEKSGALVVRAPAGSGEGVLIEMAGGPQRLAHEEHVAIVAAAEREQWDAAPLVSSVKALLGSAPELAGIGEVIVARVDDQSGALRYVPALIVSDASLPVLRATATTWSAPSTSVAKKKKGTLAPTLVLNLECPAVAGALGLATHDVWLASFLALRLAVPPAPVADGVSALTAWTSRSST